MSLTETYRKIRALKYEKMCRLKIIYLNGFLGTVTCVIISYPNQWNSDIPEYFFSPSS